MENSHLAELLKDKESLKLFRESQLLIDVSALIYEAMKRKNVTRKQLAEMLNVSKGRISHYLSGQHNMRLKTLADIFAEMGFRLRPTTNALEDLHDGSQWHVISNEEAVCRPSPNFEFVNECLRYPADSSVTELSI